MEKLSVLINDLATYAQYVDLLRTRYNVELIKYSEIFGRKDTPKIDLILFTGGEDVNPSYYGERVGKFTSINKSRDAVETDMFRKYYVNIPKLGICRGAQFLTVMNGGKLVQHVENHGIGGTHSISFGEGDSVKKLEMTSTHHQMMYPFNLKKGKDYILCAHSTRYLSPIYWDGENKDISIPDEFLEPEIVFYPESRSLAIQGHPESNVMNEEDRNFILDYISSMLKI